MKRSQKPYVQFKKVGGRLRPYYRMTWFQDGRRRERFIPLPDDPDSEEFDRAYWAIRSGTSEALKKPERDTWGDLIRAYRAHPKFTRLAYSTRRSYDRILNEIAEKNGDKAVRSITRSQVRAIHAKYVETPRRADWMVQIISLLLNFARNTLDWNVENVAEGIELYGKQREFEPWPDWMVSALDTAPAAVRTAAELILGTGQRPNAAIIMRHDHFRGEWMDVLDEKTDTRIEVYSPPSLRAFLAAQPKRGTHIIAKNLTEPLGYSAIEKAFRGWRAGLGAKAKPYTLHGLRKLAIVRLAEAGCTDAQIQSITNQTPEMIAYYRSRANRKRLSKSAMTMMERNKTET